MANDTQKIDFTKSPTNDDKEKEEVKRRENEECMRGRTPRTPQKKKW
jgi:hypothetical protein